MGLLFALSALVQLNDPDPLRWVLAYGAVALVAFTAPLRLPGLTETSAVLALLYLLWAGWLVRGGLPPVSVEALFGDATMKTEAVELWRESLGLGLMALYLIGVAVWSRAQATSPR